MSLPASQVTDPGAQLNFEELVRQARGLLGVVKSSSAPQRRMSSGAGTVTFTASQTSASTSVTHGLGVVPSLVLLVGAGAPALNLSVDGGPTTTTFGATGFWIPGAMTGSSSFYWLAIG